MEFDIICLTQKGINLIFALGISLSVIYGKGLKEKKVLPLGD